MEINTKYNIGDYVYIIHKDLPMKVEITGVKVIQNKSSLFNSIHKHVEYNVKIVGIELTAYSVFITEDYVYATQDELFDGINKLLSMQNK